jgi:hypothetical protein
VGVGEHTISASFVPDDYYAPGGTDPTVSITVVPDTSVSASGVGVSYPTFYPYRDNYRDTVEAKGSRNEPLKVSIKVINPNGRTIKTASLAEGTGAYKWAWSGRNSSGSMYATGKYKVVQTLTDRAGHVLVVTSYTNLSKKRLYTYKSTLTKTYSQRTRESANGVAWQFTMPTATVYKKVVFSVYAKSSPAGWFGPHDFATCEKTTWQLDCAEPFEKIGSSWAWRSLTASAGSNRSGTYVRLYAVASTRSNLKYGRVTVTYGVLK